LNKSRQGDWMTLLKSPAIIPPRKHVKLYMKLAFLLCISLVVGVMIMAKRQQQHRRLSSIYGVNIDEEVDDDENFYLGLLINSNFSDSVDLWIPEAITNEISINNIRLPATLSIKWPTNERTEVQLNSTELSWSTVDVPHYCQMMMKSSTWCVRLRLLNCVSCKSYKVCDSAGSTHGGVSTGTTNGVSAFLYVTKTKGLSEWIDFHSESFDHFYVYSSDIEVIEDLKDWILQGAVTVVLWSREQNRWVPAAIDDCVRRFEKQIGWLAVFHDLDYIESTEALSNTRKYVVRLSSASVNVFAIRASCISQANRVQVGGFVTKSDCIPLQRKIRQP